MYCLRYAVPPFESKTFEPRNNPASLFASARRALTGKARAGKTRTGSPRTGKTTVREARARKARKREDRTGERSLAVAYGKTTGG
jgi:hypothetical protein